METDSGNLKKICDSREPEIIKQKLLALGWQVKALSSGDYFFHTCDFKKVGITRKSIGDLLNSISKKPNPDKLGQKEKAFGQQLEEMQDYYDIKIILLEGSWQIMSPSQHIVSGRGVEYYTWDMVWNFLRTWQDKGYSIEPTINEGHTIQRLNALYAYYQKSYHTGALPHNWAGDDRVLAMPSGCRGKTGLKLLEELGSLQAIANTDYNKLLLIDGIGEKRAESIILHFRRGGNK